MWTIGLTRVIVVMSNRSRIVTNPMLFATLIRWEMEYARITIMDLCATTIWVIVVRYPLQIEAMNVAIVLVKYRTITQTCGIIMG